MLKIKNIKFENDEDLYKIVDIVVQMENSPIILLSTSEEAREFFIQQVTAALLERYNIQLHNTTPDAIINKLIESVMERDLNLSAWKEFLNVGHALCIDGIEFLGRKTTCQKELYSFLRDFTKPIILGLRDTLPQDDNHFIPQFREFVERGKVIKLALKNDIVSIEEV